MKNLFLEVDFFNCVQDHESFKKKLKEWLIKELKPNSESDIIIEESTGHQ